MTSRRLLVVVLLLALGLTACGRGTPRVVAEDGRGSDRSTDTIWIPETRDVDPGPDRRAVEDDREDRPERADRGSRTKAATSTSHAETDETTRRESRGPRDAERESPQVPDREGVPLDEPSTSSPNAPAGPPEREPRTPPTSETSPQEPVEPESVGDCGQARDQHQPSREELERAAEALRTEVAGRWPQTHGGVWVTEGARPEVRVAFTQGVRENLEALCEGFEHPHRLHGVQVSHSARQLEQLHEEMVAERDDLRRGEGPEDLPEAIRATDGRYLVAVDLPANALVVVIEQPTTELLHALRDRYTSQLHVEQGDVNQEGPEGSSPATQERETA